MPEIRGIPRAGEVDGADDDVGLEIGGEQVHHGGLDHMRVTTSGSDVITHLLRDER